MDDLRQSIETAIADAYWDWDANEDVPETSLVPDAARRVIAAILRHADTTPKDRDLPYLNQSW
jgi:hypothetical protein